MKMKEKGLDAESLQRGDGPKVPKGSAVNHKFNAFKEMAFIAKNGKPSERASTSTGKDKRKREEEVEEDRKRKKIQEIIVEYLGTKHHVTPEGTLADPSLLVPPTGHVLRFENCGPEGDWRILKVSSRFFVFVRSRRVLSWPLVRGQGRLKTLNVSL